MSNDEGTDMNQNQTTDSAAKQKSDPLPWLIRNLRQKQVNEAAGEAEFVAPKEAK
jgi:hypothetical protein